MSKESLDEAVVLMQSALEILDGLDQSLAAAYLQVSLAQLEARPTSSDDPFPQTSA